MRRLLPLVPLVLLVLFGLGWGTARLAEAGARGGCGAQAAAWSPLSARDQPPRRCHGKPSAPFDAAVPTGVPVDTDRPGLAREARPWPGFLTPGLPPFPDRSPQAFGRAIRFLPASFPAPLMRTCVLRI